MRAYIQATFFTHTAAETSMDSYENKTTPLNSNIEKGREKYS